MTEKIGEISNDWIWSPFTDITGLILSGSTYSYVSLFTPCESPRIFNKPWWRVYSSKDDSMIWRALSTLSINSWTVILPAISIDSNWERLVFQWCDNLITVIFQFNITLNLVFGFWLWNRAWSLRSCKGIIRLKDHSKIFYVFVGIYCPPSHTSIISIRSWAVNNLLFCQVNILSFLDHVNTLDGSKRCKRVTSSTLFLVFDWSHLFSCFPINFDFL